MKYSLLLLMILNITFLQPSTLGLSKKNISDNNLNRDYQRGTFLIVLANSDFYDRLEYSALGYNFIDFKKLKGLMSKLFHLGKETKILLVLMQKPQTI